MENGRNVDTVFFSIEEKQKRKV
ncbi:uncharacterized protein METZ01_LOCUS354308 [marine metagenome]|uniref:Uncharacterized protein n=1 Tax=marine metagenome TaxID=408172 RepID=A0A382RUV4_9ZZZZ